MEETLDWFWGLVKSASIINNYLNVTKFYCFNICWICHCFMDKVKISLKTCFICLGLPTWFAHTYRLSYFHAVNSFSNELLLKSLFASWTSLSCFHEQLISHFFLLLFGLWFSCENQEFVHQKKRLFTKLTLKLVFVYIFQNLE